MIGETGGITPAPDKFHRELEALKNRLLELASLAGKAIELSVQAFMKRDEDLAHQIILGDKTVNELEETIDGECVRLIALFQPVAIDLRQLMAVNHISAELERIGDSATNIAEEVLVLKNLPRRPTHPELLQMALEVLKMVRQSLQAFLKRDPTLARQICKADNIVDEMDRDIITELLEDMTGNPEGITAGQSQINVVRNLERVGDHATNIAEQVVYMVEGESIRHRCQG